VAISTSFLLLVVEEIQSRSVEDQKLRQEGSGKWGKTTYTPTNPPTATPAKGHRLWQTAIYLGYLPHPQKGTDSGRLPFIWVIWVKDWASIW
jgi:hypothetical protein